MMHNITVTQNDILSNFVSLVSCTKYQGNKNGKSLIMVHGNLFDASANKSLVVGEVVEFTVVTQEDGRRKAVNVTGPNGGDVQRQRQQQFGQTTGINGLVVV